MRPLTRPGLLLAIAVAVVAVPTAASGALSGTAAPTGIAANSTTYQDSAGENPAAPDITTLTTSNNDAGLVSFKIDIPNRPTLTQDLLLLVFVDTDANPQTGDPTRGATSFIEPALQDRLVAAGPAGYRLTYAEVRERWIAGADTTFQQASSVSHRSSAWLAQGDVESRRGNDGVAAGFYRRAARALREVDS